MAIGCAFAVDVASIAREGASWPWRLPSSPRFLLLLLTAFGCGDSDSEARGCRELSEQKRFAEARVACEAAFASSSEPGLGLLAARASFEQGDDLALELWTSRLQGTSVEPRFHGLLASAAERAGRVDAALEHHAARLRLERQSGDSRAAADTAYRAFYLAWRESRYHQALEAALVLEQAAVETGDKALRSRAAQALFSVLFAIGDLAGAERAHRQAGELLSEEASDRVYWLLNQAALRLESGRPALARAAITRALELAGQEAEPVLRRSLELNGAEAALALGAMDAAEAHIAAAEGFSANPAEWVSSYYFRARLAQQRGHADRALREARAALAADPERGWRWELELIAAQAERSLGREPEAQAALRRSIAEVEALGAALDGAALREVLLDHKRQPYEELFELLLASGQSLAALEVAEKAVARSVWSAFAAGREPADEAAWRPAEAVVRSQSLVDLEAALRSQKGLPELSTVLASFGSTKIWFYFEAGSGYFLLEVERGRIHSRLLGTKIEVESAIRAWLSHPEDEGANDALSRLLLPAGVRAPGKDPSARLLVVPDGDINRVSFAALRLGASRLVDRAEISYLTNLRAITPAGRGRGGTSPMVLADPGSDLPAARAEGSEIAAFLGVAPKLGSAASLETLRRVAAAPLLHVAGHAGLDAAGPWLGFADGLLRPGEVLRLGLAPELVVLASCDSAAAPGRGLAGSLPAAFLAAGSRAVVAALGSVEDDVALRFVRQFYTQGGAERPVSALAEVQRQAARRGEPVSSWAPFVVLGAW